MAFINMSRLKKRKAVICTSVVVSLFFIFKSEISSNYQGEGNISCHFYHGEDGLTPIGNPSPRSIFFHDTSCKGYLNSRESCAIESAIRAHSDWQIYVIFSGPIPSVTLNEGSFKILKKYPNIKFSRVHILEYARNTSVERIVESGSLNRLRWKVEDTSHVLRFLTLYKYGGVFMDLDVIVARPISSLARNWVSRQSNMEVAAGIMAFSRDGVGRKVAEDAIRNKVEFKITTNIHHFREFSDNYKPSDWYNNGPGVITRVLQKRCSTPHASYMSAATCEGFEVYGPQFFYPIKEQNARSYYVPGDLNIQNAYTHYLWGHITKNYKVHKGSPYERLAKRYCPNIYHYYAAQFRV